MKLSKEKLEGEFIALLGRLRPNPETVSEFPRIAAQVWAQTQRDTEKTVKRLTQHLVEQKRLKGELLRAKLRGEVPQEDYQQANLEFAEEITAIESQLGSAQSQKTTTETFLRFAELQLMDIAGAWQRARDEQR